MRVRFGFLCWSHVSVILGQHCRHDGIFGPTRIRARIDKINCWIQFAMTTENGAKIVWQTMTINYINSYNLLYLMSISDLLKAQLNSFLEMGIVVACNRSFDLEMWPRKNAHASNVDLVYVITNWIGYEETCAEVWKIWTSSDPLMKCSETLSIRQLLADHALAPAIIVRNTSNISFAVNSQQPALTYPR